MMPYSPLPMAATTENRSAAARRWLGDALDGEVTRWDALTTGNSRTTTLADVRRDGGPARPVVVRSEEGDGPFDGTELSLAREVLLYRALAGRGVRLPEVLAFDPEAELVAMTRVSGEPVWTPQALDDLLAELARLHALAPAELDLPGLAQTSRGDVELWGRIAAARIAPASPLVDFAVDLLLDHHPGEPARLVLCHGDAGPGNFLHDGTTLTGLLDWEFAHVGDPLDDLAWITVRAVLFGVELPDFPRRVREHYAAATGVELDPARLRYWQAVVILRNLVTCLASTSNPVRGRDRLVHHMIVPPLQVMLVTAMARVAGVGLAPVAPIAAAHALPARDVLADIAQDLTGVVDALEDPAWRTRAKRMRLLLGQLAETLPAAPAIAAADRAEPPAADTADRLAQLDRQARRHLQLFPRAAAMAAAPIQGL